MTVLPDSNPRTLLEDVRGYLLAAIGDAEGRKAVERHRMLSLTAGQVQCLAEALGLVEAALADSNPRNVP